MPKLRHNKKRNLGLVFEFLTREVSEAVVNEDADRAGRVLAIIERHLGEGSQLHDELALHRSVMESRGVGAALARRIVDELKAAGIRLSSRESREAAKSALIHEMNRTLGQEVFDRWRIPDYTAHASIYLLMSRGVDARLDESVEVARVEEHLTEFLKSPAPQAERFDRDASLYAYDTAVKLYEKEYSRELNESQNRLLKEYVRVELGGNRAPFERIFEAQRTGLREFFKVARHDEIFATDPEMSTRLDEAITDLDALDPSVEESVERLMLYHNLMTEIQTP